MAQDSTLHVKVEPTMAKDLKRLARKRKQTMGELVRQAIVACYQTELLGLTAENQQALAAYRGGYISLGKLAEAMGLNALAMRTWLNERGIKQNVDYAGDDAVHA